MWIAHTEVFLVNVCLRAKAAIQWHLTEFNSYTNHLSLQL